MQPLQYYLRDPAAKDHSITHAAAAPSNLDAATIMRSADSEFGNTIELRAMASELQLQNRISTPTRKTKDFQALCKRNSKGKLLAPKLRKSSDK